MIKSFFVSLLSSNKVQARKNKVDKIKKKAALQAYQVSSFHENFKRTLMNIAKNKQTEFGFGGVYVCTFR